MALALAGLYQPRWSEEILNEAERNLALRIGPDTAAERISELQQLFPEAMVDDYADRLQGLANDPKDRHVVAVAIACKAKNIVTGNLKDFHPIPRDINPVLPDAFLYGFIDRMGDLWVFRRIPATDSEVIRPPVPSVTGH